MDFKRRTTSTIAYLSGKEVSIDDERSLIVFYFYRGYTYQSIVKLLDEKHDIQIIERTLKYRLQSYSLRRRSPTYDLAQVRLRVAEELDGPEKLCCRLAYPLSGRTSSSSTSSCRSGQRTRPRGLCNEEKQTTTKKKIQCTRSKLLLAH